MEKILTAQKDVATRIQKKVKDYTAKAEKCQRDLDAGNYKNAKEYRTLEKNRDVYNRAIGSLRFGSHT